MRLIPAKAELQRHVDHLQQRVMLLMRRSVQEHARRVRELATNLPRIIKARLGHERLRTEREVGRLMRQRPSTQLAERQSRLAALSARLEAAVRRRVDQSQRLNMLARNLEGATKRHIRRVGDRLNATQRRLAALDPHGIIHRGYSITMLRDGSIVRLTSDVRVGDSLVTRVSDGAIESAVARTGAASPAARNRKRSADGPGQLDLFGSPK
jgi:exodeoxyribonuclease VII large subunit